MIPVQATFIPVPNFSGYVRVLFGKPNRLCTIQILFNFLIVMVIVSLTMVEYCYRPVHMVYKNKVYVVKSSVRIEQDGSVDYREDNDPDVKQALLSMNFSTELPVLQQKHLLTLFSSWADSSEKKQVYAGTLKLWKHWYPDIVPLLFSNDKKLGARVSAEQWPVFRALTNPRCRGPPVLPAMFKDSMTNFNSYFYGFANADIAFGNGLMNTLQFLLKNQTFWENPYLIIGRRTYFNFSEYQEPIISPDTVDNLMKEGESIHWSTDYFITSRNFPWEDVIKLSIGRPLFCRWIISFALSSNIPVIDASNTIEALHLTTQDGNRSSFQEYPGMKCNWAPVQKSKFKVKMHLGRVECATLETVYDSENTVRLQPRAASPTECPGAYNAKLKSSWKRF